MMKTPPQSRPMHHALSTYTPGPKHFTFPNHPSYDAHTECRISKTGLGWSHSRFASPSPECRRIVLSDWNEQSSTKKDSDASTSLPNGRDRRYVRLFHRRFFVYQTSAFVASGGMQTTLVYSLRSDFRHKLRLTNLLQKTQQPGTFGPLSHNLHKWATSDTNQPEQQNGTARRGLAKTEKPRMDRNAFGVYV